MNFGHKITVVYVAFVIFMLSLVTLCIKKKDLFLVSSDYYKKEIAYQSEIDKYSNTQKLSVPVKIERNESDLTFQFPEESKNAKGEILFYRPSNASLDFSIPIKLDVYASQKVETNKLVKGLWVVKMEWEQNGKGYLKEQKVIL